MFGILNQINSNVFSGASEGLEAEIEKRSETKVRYKVNIHHSRDSASKQWASTLVLALRGLERVLRQFFTNLITASTLKEHSREREVATEGGDGCWFESAWSRIVDFAFKCATQVGGRETSDIRLAGVDLLILCSQVSSGAGIAALTTPARVGTNMQVVNGALRSVRAANTGTQGVVATNDSGEAHPLVISKKHRLFLESFGALEGFKSYLNDDMSMALEIESGSSTVFVETILSQVLTRMAQGLSKLYECLQSEYNPGPRRSIETRFVDIVATVMSKAGGGQRSKYLTHAQRLCLELLENMGSQSPSPALVKLAEVGDRAFFW